MRHGFIILAALVAVGALGYWAGTRASDTDPSAERQRAERQIAAADSAHAAARRAWARDSANYAGVIAQLSDEAHERAQDAARQRHRANAASAEAARMRAIYADNPTLETCHDALSACETANVVLREENEALEGVTESQAGIIRAQGEQLLLTEQHYDTLLDAYAELRAGCETCMTALEDTESTIARLERRNQLLTYAALSGATAVAIILLTR